MLAAYKRLFDIAFSAFALLSFAPFLLIVALVIFIVNPGPVFFVHERVGRNGKPFGCIKFRTMRVNAQEALDELLATDADARQSWETFRKLPNDPRVIPVLGNVMRRTSIDELPQFLNVLLGQMSVVGPRPITREELERYGPAREAYLSCRPGITGLWQSSGRSKLSFEERIRYDVEYSETASPLMDIRIIFVTALQVLFCRSSS
ncbi:MAG: sugar transferase [Pseudomonadota bacterium]